jgi:hypothetical protein
MPIRSMLALLFALSCPAWAQTATPTPAPTPMPKPAQSFASEPRYTYAEGGWIRNNPDDADTDNGWFLGGQFGLFRSVHLLAEYADLGDVETWQLGGGWHGLLGDRADIVAEAAYLDADSDNGYRLTGGVRWYVLEQLEVDGNLTRTDVGDFENNTFGVGAVWDLKTRLSVGARLDFGDEGDAMRVFVRFYFPRRS